MIIRDDRPETPQERNWRLQKLLERQYAVTAAEQGRAPYGDSYDCRCAKA